MGTSELSGKPDEMLRITCDGLASHPGGVAILLITGISYGGVNHLARVISFSRFICVSWRKKLPTKVKV